MMTRKVKNMMLFQTLFLVIWLPFQTDSAFTFDTCNDWGSNYKGSGNCTIVQQDGALGAETTNTVWTRDGYLDYGNFWAGCPYKINTCQTGFSYYGWIKFKSYPRTCTDSGVVVSTEVFNLHLKGNGHLAVYSWLADGNEYYAESSQPASLDIWHPIVIQFEHIGITPNDIWKLSLYVQGQLVAFVSVGRQRTYTPPNTNLLFGGSGNGDVSRSTSIQLDTATFDYAPRDFTTIYQALLNIFLRQAYCAGKYGIQTNALTCYWVETGPMNWGNAYSSCSKNAYNYGFPYSRLARFPNWNSTVWNEVMKRIAFYGNGTNGYNAWIGGGRQMQWLDSAMNPVGVQVVVPDGVTYVRNDQSMNISCLQVNTKTWPWQWIESSCGVTQNYICEMSFDCLLNNPCKNLGVCHPNNDGNNMCSCWPGTSGQFCETGTPSLSCTNNCQPCSVSGGLRIPDNCANCRTRFQSLLSLYSQLEVKMKLQLIILNVDVDQAEAWQSYVVEEFYNFTKMSSNNVNGFDLPECDMVWTLSAKCRLHDKIVRKLYRKIQQTSPNSLPSDVTTLWQTVNRTRDEVNALKCFTDVTSNVQQFDNITKYQMYFADNDIADNHWLKGRFHDESMSGHSNTGLMYFGEMKNHTMSNNGNNNLINNQNINNQNSNNQNFNQNLNGGNGATTQNWNNQNNNNNQNFNNQNLATTQSWNNQNSNQNGNNQNGNNQNGNQQIANGNQNNNQNFNNPNGLTTQNWNNQNNNQNLNNQNLNNQHGLTTQSWNNQNNNQNMNNQNENQNSNVHQNGNNQDQESNNNNEGGTESENENTNSKSENEEENSNQPNSNHNVQNGNANHSNQPTSNNNSPNENANHNTNG